MFNDPILLRGAKAEQRSFQAGSQIGFFTDGMRLNYNASFSISSTSLSNSFVVASNGAGLVISTPHFFNWFTG